MIKCIAIDDEPLALELIETFCSSLHYVHLVGTFTKSSSATEYLIKNTIDLIFLDIHMPDMNGMDLIKSLRPECMIIFTTAHPQYAVESYTLNAVDYLLKPLAWDRFIQACEKAKEYHTQVHAKDKSISNYLYIRSEYALVKIIFKDILFIETMDDYVKIHQIGKKPFLTLMSLRKMMERLPSSEFIRVHRSYIVPLNKIESVRGKSIFLGVTEIPIGHRYEKEFFTAYMKDRY